MSAPLISPAAVDAPAVPPGRLYRPRGGVVTVAKQGLIPVDGTRIPGYGTGHFADDPGADNRWAMPAMEARDVEDGDFASWTAGAAAELLHRLMPTATCYAAPRFRSDDSEGKPFGGPAFFESGTMLATTRVGASLFLGVILHEAWHLLDPYLSDTERVAVNGMIDMGEAWPGQYLDCRVERRARAFEAWGNYLLEGGEHFSVQTPGRRSAHEVFQRIWDGTIGAEIAAGRRIWRQVPAE